MLPRKRPAENVIVASRQIPNGIPMLEAKRSKSSGGLVRTGSNQRSRPNSSGSSASSSTSNGRNYNVLIRKKTMKKNKPWDWDGKLVVPSDPSSPCVLLSDEGGTLGRQQIQRSMIVPDNVINMGGYEISINDDDLEIESSSVVPLSTPKFSAMKTLPTPKAKEVIDVLSSDEDEKENGNDGKDDEDEITVVKQVPAKTPVKTLKASGAARPIALTSTKSTDAKAEGANKSNSRIRYEVLMRKPAYNSKAPYTDDGELEVKQGIATLRNAKGRVIGTLKLDREIKPDQKLSMGGKEILVGELVDESIKEPIPNPEIKLQPSAMSTRVADKPKYNPSAEDAIILPRFKSSKDVIDVVIDPHLGRKLRPHQIDGVRFLYECVMGMRSENGGKGALLADEMGLGKTLMTITLIWTLLNQNPIKGERPVVKRALIACPVTLLHNWKSEFNRWLETRVKVFVMHDKADIGNFKYSRNSIMLIGYDRLRILNDQLNSCKFDLIVCDEAQKLKKVDTRSTQAIINLGIERKIMLSGTPIQNNLSEFFAMAEVLNPGSLGSAATFKRQFEVPIMKGREAMATSKLRQAAESKLKELTNKTSGFVLRRTNELIADSLPSRTDTILFCKPTVEQAKAYTELCNSSDVWKEIDELCEVDIEKKADLGTMTKLKKICNSPMLLDDRIRLDALAKDFYSGKMAVLKNLLLVLKHGTQEKIVIVSQYTKTLDLIEQMLGQLGMSSTRLDGTTAAGNRQQLVDSFNRTNQDASFVFMTSTRSGGAGINLIGASRLVLFDCDWNPSWDNQAMARIHRMGQKRPVYIYRLLTTGCIDECIFQRQITKQNLADQFMDGGSEAAGSSSSSSNSFTKDELRDIFTFHGDTKSHTHDLLGCQCQSQDKAELVCLDIDSDNEDESMGGFTTAATVASDGVFVPKALRPETRMKGLVDYRHRDPKGNLTDLNDKVLLQVLRKAPVSFIMTKCNK